MENPIKLDDLVGFPIFLETPIYRVHGKSENNSHFWCHFFITSNHPIWFVQAAQVSATINMTLKVKG